MWWQKHYPGIHTVRGSAMIYSVACHNSIIVTFPPHVTRKCLDCESIVLAKQGVRLIIASLPGFCKSSHYGSDICFRINGLLQEARPFMFYWSNSCTPAYAGENV